MVISVTSHCIESDMSSVRAVSVGPNQWFLDGHRLPGRTLSAEHAIMAMQFADAIDGMPEPLPAADDRWQVLAEFVRPIGYTILEAVQLMGLDYDVSLLPLMVAVNDQVPVEEPWSLRAGLSAFVERFRQRLRPAPRPVILRKNAVPTGP